MGNLEAFELIIAAVWIASIVISWKELRDRRNIERFFQNQ